MVGSGVPVDLAALRANVVARAEAHGVRLVRFLYCDNDGIIRGKASGVSRLADRLTGGIGLTVAMQAFSLLDRLATVEGMGPVGEIRLVPDPETFVVAPFAPHTGVVLVERRRTTWRWLPRSSRSGRWSRLARTAPSRSIAASASPARACRARRPSSTTS